MPSILAGKRPGVWKIRVYARPKEIKETFYGSKEDAKRRAKKLDAEKDSRPQPVKRKCIRDYEATYQAARFGGPAVRVTRRNALAPFVERFGDKRFEDLDPDDIREYAAHEIECGNRKTGGPLAPRTLRNRLEELRRMLRKAFKEGQMTTDLADTVDVPRKEKVEIETLEDWEAALWMKLTAGSPEEIPIAIGLCAGLRRGEMLGLRRSDVDLSSGIIRVRKARKGKGRDGAPKTGYSVRSVPIPSQLVESLRAHFARQDRLSSSPARQRDDRPVCTGRDGRPVSAYWLTHLPARVAKEHGLRRIRFHDLRHTYATLLLEAGVSLSAVSANLGHSSEAITAILYGHITPKSERDVRATLQLILGGVAPAFAPDDDPTGSIRSQNGRYA